MRQVRINADDFGWVDGHNLAVRKAFLAGGLQQASLLTTTPGFQQAVCIAHELPGLQVGIHLALNEVAPACPEAVAPLLQGGRFPDNPLRLVQMWVQGTLPVEGIIREWHAQIRRAVEAGIRPMHLNSHKHVHVLPPLVEGVCRLAHEFAIPYVRLPLEPLRVAIRRPAAFLVWGMARMSRPYLEESGLAFSAVFYGVAFSGGMTLERLADALSMGPSVEVMVHPAVETAAIQA
ncbi:ChbG/HpnK family deacetylase, partial [Candidatus Parcubacteria bacterium]